MTMRRPHTLLSTPSLALRRVPWLDVCGGLAPGALGAVHTKATPEEIEETTGHLPNVVLSPSIQKGESP